MILFCHIVTCCDMPCLIIYSRFVFRNNFTANFKKNWESNVSLQKDVKLNLVLGPALKEKIQINLYIFFYGKN